MENLSRDIIFLICKELKNNDINNFGRTCKKNCKYSLNNKHLWIYKLKEFNFEYKTGDPKYFYKFMLKCKNPFYGAYKDNVMNAINENSYELTEHFINSGTNLNRCLELAIHKDNLDIIQLLLSWGADQKIYETKYFFNK